MTEEIEAHIAAVEALYRDLITDPNGRLTGGARLWAQFEDAVEARRRHGAAKISGIIERVNELAMARGLLQDSRIAADIPIEYEPEIVPGGGRIDFVVADYEGAPLYTEVKTVHPWTEDSDANWQKVEQRRERLTENTHFIVAKDWLGAQIFGDAFSARSSFLRYAREAEERFAAAQSVRPGRGVLVVCGNRFHWHVDELEDFADFYRTGQHRPDDPFAAMEQHHIAEHGITLRRNIDAFAALIRPDDSPEVSRFIYPVRGPKLP